VPPVEAWASSHEGVRLLFSGVSGRLSTGFRGDGPNGLAKVVGGEGGIRTLGTFRYTRFPVVHLRPLGHLSRDRKRAGNHRRFGRNSGRTPDCSESESPARVPEHWVEQWSGTGRALAERGGFEPPVACATLDFESSTFDHSDTSPGVTAIRANRACARSLDRADAGGCMHAPASTTAACA
jgi:hypothetical protein